ncbi:pyridoxamine 5'-phosphate oxidase family protein [Streptomyces tritici]|uniref:pyridoxamine 5'-phosphate oxidase family protein n=1 Tax=Streptomyces tritici TaxID=2054410 RepID=UPI003AEF4723
MLATRQPDGSPQTSVVWVSRDGDELLVSSQAGRRKIKNMEADPWVSLLVYDRHEPLRYAEIRGRFRGRRPRPGRRPRGELRRPGRGSGVSGTAARDRAGGRADHSDQGDRHRRPGRVANARAVPGDGRSSSLLRTGVVSGGR